MLVEDGIHGIHNRNAYVQALIGMMYAVRAIIALGHHLHLELCGFDGVAHAYHLSELAVTAELGVGRNENIAQISAGIDEIGRAHV